MEKVTFTYQRWLLRVCYFCIFLFFVALPYIQITELFRLPEDNFWYDIGFILINLSFAGFYFKYTQNSKWFLCEGEYWVDDGVVFIKTRKKTYELKDVKAILGLTKSFRGHAKSGMLKIDFGRRKSITLFSTSKEGNKLFSDTELYPLFELVLEYNPELKRDETPDFWYAEK